MHWSGHRLPHVLGVDRGRLKVRRFDTEGSEHILSWFGPGDLVGIAAVIADKPFHFDVVADGPCQVVQVSRSGFLDLLRQDPELAVNLITLLSERLLFVTESHPSQAKEPLSERIWHRLTRMAKQQAPSAPAGAWDIAMTQGELASAVGASRYRVGLALQKLVERRVIALSRGRIRLLK